MDRHSGAQIVDEMDDEDNDDLSYGGQTSVASDLPPGVANTERGQPQNRRADERNQEPNLTVVETDDDGQPLHEERIDAEPRHEVEYGHEAASQNQASTEQPDRRPRLSRAERTRRQREHFSRIEQDNQELREQMALITQTMGQIEPRLSEIDQARRVSEVRELDRQVQTYQHQATLARQRLKDALANQDPESFEAALDARDAAVRNAEALAAQKRNLEAAIAAPRQQPQTQPQQFQVTPQLARLPVEIRNRVDDFAEANPWYKPHDTKDMDSQIILRLDDQVASEGFDPRTDAYWNELEARAARYLPHRFDNASNQRQETRPMPRQTQMPPQQAPERRGPMVAGGSQQGNSPAPQNNRVMITPDRKQAMIEVGVMASDGGILDRGRYNRLIKGYHDFDRQNASAVR